MRALLLCALLGCAEPPPSQYYSCVILYHCVGSDVLTARVGLTCEEGLDQANDRMVDLGVELADLNCEEGWRYVRAVCANYEPTTECQEGE